MNMNIQWTYQPFPPPHSYLQEPCVHKNRTAIFIGLLIATFSTSRKHYLFARSFFSRFWNRRRTFRHHNAHFLTCQEIVRVVISNSSSAFSTRDVTSTLFDPAFLPPSARLPIFTFGAQSWHPEPVFSGLFSVLRCVVTQEFNSTNFVTSRIGWADGSASKIYKYLKLLLALDPEARSRLSCQREVEIVQDFIPCQPKKATWDSNGR